MLKMLDLFSGIGGFSLAAQWTGKIQTIAFCEIDLYAKQVLKKNFPNIPIESDIRDLKNEGQFGKIDIICGGFPCQPFSIAGKQKGKNDNRDLWPEMFRVIQEFKPTWVISENVANFINMALERTCIDLEAEGYETQSFIIPAFGVNAKHERKRCWTVAYSRCIESWSKKSRFSGKPNNGSKTIQWTTKGDRSSDSCKTSNARKRAIKSDMGRNFNGLSTRLDGNWEQGVNRIGINIPNRAERIKCLGNAIVPQVVYPIFQGIVNLT